MESQPGAGKGVEASWRAGHRIGCGSCERFGRDSFLLDQRHRRPLGLLRHCGRLFLGKAGNHHS
jgi:hypothetical protein